METPPVGGMEKSDDGVLHELGHALGYFGHSPNTYDTMHDDVTYDNLDATLKYDDTYALKQLYNEYYMGDM